MAVCPLWMFHERRTGKTGAALPKPCFKILDCWWEHFDVVQYLKDHLPEDQFSRLMEARPKPKVASLVELIEQARKCNS